MSLRKYKTKDIVEKIAIEKYQKNGLGITFEDIEREFFLNKAKAQRTLKYFHDRQVLFTANDLKSERIIVLKNTSPQQYFPSLVKAKIIEDLAKRNNVLVDPTGVDLLAPPPPSSKSAFPPNDLDIVMSFAQNSTMTMNLAKLLTNDAIQALNHKDINGALEHLRLIGQEIGIRGNSMNLMNPSSDTVVRLK